MRVFCAVILLLLAGAVGLFAYYNPEPITLKYLDRSVTCSLPILLAIVYGLGMLSGWSVLGMIRRSFRRVTEGQPATYR